MKIIILLILSLFYIRGEALPKLKDSAVLVLEKLKSDYKSGRVDENKYLKQVHAAMLSFLSSDIYFTNQELINQLTLFRKIAWSNKKYEANKRTYYSILCNQAQMAERGGEMLYYAEKLDVLEQSLTKRPSITALTIRTDYFRSIKSYQNIVNIFEQEKKFIHSLPEMAKKDSLSPTELVQSIIFLEKISETLYKEKDTINGDFIFKTLNIIAYYAKLKNPNNTVTQSYITFCKNRIQFQKANARNNRKDIEISFKSINEQYINDSTPLFLKHYIFNLYTEEKIAYFIKNKQNDSSNYYLKQYQDSYIDDETDDKLANEYFIRLSKALILYNNKEYKESAQLMHTAAKLAEKSKVRFVKDVDKILYAHAKAEESNIELQTAKLQLKKRNTLILIISLLFSGIIIATIARFYIKVKQVKKRIKDLDEATAIHIGSLEYIKQMITISVQERIGKDIHDDLSPTIISMQHQLGFIISDIEDNTIKLKLEALKQQMNDTYQNIRQKSHQLNFSITEFDDIQFEQKITQLINRALPDDHYKKNIHVAEGTIQHLNIDHRIEIFRILQEAVTNIIKHSNAENVTIAVYEENRLIILLISDDGKGFDVSKINENKKSLGLLSIHERVNKNSGQLKITSGKNGTILEISFSKNLS